MRSVSTTGELAPVQFKTTRYLPAPPAVVFELISDHAALPTWLYPRIGVPGTEVVVGVEPPFRLSYSATDESLRGFLTAHRSELHCAAYGDGTELSWTIRGRLAPSWWKRWIARLVFARAIRTGVKNLERRFATPR